MRPRHFPWIPDSYMSCVSIAYSDGRKPRTWLFEHDDLPEDAPTHRECLDEIQMELDNAKRIVAHNLKFDLHWLSHYGIDYSKPKLYCTMLGEYLVRGQRKQEGIDLATLSKEYNIGNKLDKTKLYWDAGYDTCEIPLHILIPYCERDAINALLIFTKQVQKIKELRLERLVALEMEALSAIQWMEETGMNVDSALLERYNREYLERLDELSIELAQTLGIENPRSGDQLSKGLFGFDGEDGLFDPKKYKIDPLKKAGFYSTDVANLSKLKGSSQLQKRVLHLLKEQSRVSQLQSTYFKSLQKHAGEDGIVHQNINQAITRTGRTSCSRPNLQNVPRGNTGPVKQCFTTRF